MRKSQPAYPLLFLLTLLATSLELLWPSPSPFKVYHTIGPVHEWTMVLVPVGAWVAASRRAHPAAFIAYGAIPSLVFGLRFGHQWTWFGATDTQYIRGSIGACAIPLGMGFLCRWIALKRHARDYRRALIANTCFECGYDLTGNVSQICPECGTKSAQFILSSAREDSTWT